MFKKHGAEYIIIKGDCVGHIQKRMGTNLHNYKKDKKGDKFADGFTVGGRGRLTKVAIDRLQNYYGAAIRNNSNSSLGNIFPFHHWWKCQSSTVIVLVGQILGVVISKKL